MSEVTEFALPERFSPMAHRSGVDQPYWENLSDDRLVVQRCRSCRDWQWGPEFLCRQCLSFDVGWEEVPRRDGAYPGEVFSWERVWHPTDQALAEAVPYLAVVVSLPTAGGIRFVGNLLGDPLEAVSVGTLVRAVFEHHETYTLVQWERR